MTADCRARLFRAACYRALGLLWSDACRLTGTDSRVVLRADPWLYRRADGLFRETRRALLQPDWGRLVREMEAEHAVS